MSAIGWALVTAGIWGVVPLIEKVGLGGGTVPPMVGVMARSVGVLIGLFVSSVVWSPWKALSAMGWLSFGLLAAGGFLASFVGQVAFYKALSAAAVSQVTPAAGAYPLVAAVLGWLVFREPITVPGAVGVVLIVLGVALLHRAS